MFNINVSAAKCMRHDTNRTPFQSIDYSAHIGSQHKIFGGGNRCVSTLGNRRHMGKVGKEAKRSKAYSTPRITSPRRAPRTSIEHVDIVSEAEASRRASKHDNVAVLVAARRVPSARRRRSTCSIAAVRTFTMSVINEEATGSISVYLKHFVPHTVGNSRPCR